MLFKSFYFHTGLIFLCYFVFPGIDSLFKKLNQGCIENEKLLALANARAEAEYAYGYKLKDIPVNLAVKKDGFGADEGASLRKSFEGIITEMGEEGSHHITIAENIRKLVIQPFRKWADEHKLRVDHSYTFLRSKVDIHTKDGIEAQKIQNKYFNKCRVYDISRREDEVEKLQQQTRAGIGSPISNNAESSRGVNEHIDSIPNSPALQQSTPETPKPNNEKSYYDDEEDDDYEDVALGDIEYSKSDLQHLLFKMLHEIPQKDIKIPIIGTYDHVSTGADIVSWLTENSIARSVAVAEKIGQDLIQNGFLRLVGQVGSKFLNSSVQKYQWKKLAFFRAGLASQASDRKGAELISSMAGEYLPDSISSSISNYLNNPNPNETPTEKLEREVKDLDTKCHNAITKYDDSRMLLEEMIVHHFDFMQRCEIDRLKAIKVVMLDFTAAISNKVASLKSSVDKYLLYQESIVPERDLRYLVELYKTGPFAPKVTCYDNYYAPSKGWTFGGDLEVRARGDGKRIPLIVPTIFEYLDEQYPSLLDDEKRLGIWTVNVPLEETHKLRKEINNGQEIPKSVLDKYLPPVIASVLKLYFLELPDSVVSSKFYEHIKNIYSDTPIKSSDAPPSSVTSTNKRIKSIQLILKESKIPCLITLDAIAKHIERLIKFANPGEEYMVQIAHELGRLILRPKQQNATTMDDRHPYLFIRDVLEHREAIFEGLRRQGSSSSRKSSLVESHGSRSSRGSNVGLLQKNQNPESVFASPVATPSTPSNGSEFVSTYLPNIGDGKGLSRQASFASESETTDFHATPISSKRLVETISSHNKRDSIEITAVNENINTKYTSYNNKSSVLSTPKTPEISHSARQNESLTSSSSIPNGVEVIEVDDD